MFFWFIQKPGWFGIELATRHVQFSIYNVQFDVEHTAYGN